jgi:thioredoxin 1
MLELTEANFSGNRYNGDGKLLALFYAKWCPFCRKFLPEFERIEQDAKISLAKVDLSDTSSPLWDTFGVEVIPTAIFFENGEIKKRLDGTLGIGIRPDKFNSFAREIGAV